MDRQIPSGLQDVEVLLREIRPVERILWAVPPALSEGTFAQRNRRSFPLRILGHIKNEVARCLPIRNPFAP